MSSSVAAWLSVQMPACVIKRVAALERAAQPLTARFWAPGHTRGGSPSAQPALRVL